MFLDVCWGFGFHLPEENNVSRKKTKKLSQIIKRNFKEHTFFLVTSISFDDFSFDFFMNPAQKEIINAEIIFGLTVKIKLQPENRLLPIHI